MNTEEGTLRVWNVINPGASNRRTNSWLVSSPDEAVTVINREAEKQLKQNWIFANAFGLEVFEDGEWCEWYSEDGEGIDEYAENKDTTP